MFISEIEAYQPKNELEARDQSIILTYIHQFKNNVLTRENEIAHITSSGFILNKNQDKVLMVYHNLYNSWAWTGGHADGESDLLGVAIREAQEETGVVNVRPLIESIQSIDILPVWHHMKKGAVVSSHLHLNVTYLLIADEKEALSVKEDENSAVGWLELDKLETYCTEPYLIPVYKKLIEAAKLL